MAVSMITKYTAVAICSRENNHNEGVHYQGDWYYKAIPVEGQLCITTKAQILIKKIKAQIWTKSKAQSRITLKAKF